MLMWLSDLPRANAPRMFADNLAKWETDISVDEAQCGEEVGDPLIISVECKRCLARFAQTPTLSSAGCAGSYMEIRQPLLEAMQRST